MPNFPRLLWYLSGAMRRLHWNSVQLRAYQEKRLRSIIKYAYEFVPFYHERFKRIGIMPDDIQALDDLNKLPIIGKSELKLEPYGKLISARFNVNELKFQKTSGSTGEPFTTYLSRAEDDWRKAIYMRANISCGQKPRDRWVVITSPHHFSDTTGIQRRLGIYAQTCLSLFSDVGEQIKLVDRAKPDVLDGYSGSLLLLAKEIDKRGIDSIRPRIVFGTADLMDDPSREYIEKILDASYYDQFGCAEVDRTGWWCPEKIGYHMDVDSVIMQFVDSDGNEVSPGERGEIVYTSLFNHAMPFIRYAIGDIGIPSQEKCPCNIRLPLMKVVEGRKDSVVRLSDGRLISPMAFRVAISKFYDEIRQYRVVQKRLDLIEIHIKKRDNSVNEKSMETELVAHTRNALNIDPQEAMLTVRFVEDIPLGKNGKLMAVVSELKTSS